MGGDSYPTPDPQNFSPAAGQKSCFWCFWSKKKIRLRRAKNRVLYVFGAKNFPPAAGIQQSWFPKSFYERRNALLLFVKRSSSRADAVPGVFTSVGTRFYYLQNGLTAAQTQFLAFSQG